MTAKEFFKKIHAAERSVESAVRKVEIFKSMAEKITSSLEGETVSHTRNVHSNEDAIIRLAEAKEELARRTEVYTKLVDEISEKMTGLDDPEEEVLLTNHYLKHLSLLAVAREMHRGNSWVYDHHDAAIKKLDKILAESGDSEAS